MANLNIKTSPQAPGADYTLTPIGGGGPITGNLDINGEAVAGLTTGTQYTLQVAPVDGAFVPVTQTVSDSDVETTMQLVGSGDPASGVLPAATTPPVAQSVVAPTTPSTNVQDPEFVFPGTNDGYVTATQAKIYVGNLFIDEVNYVQFALQDNKVPIYGYRSRYFDALAQGRSLVQGQIGVNFVSEGYLYTVLKNFQTMQVQQDPATAQQAALEDEIQNLVGQLTMYVAAGNGNDPAVTAINNRLDDLAATDPDNVDLINQAVQAASDIPTIPGQGYFNATYLDIPFDLVMKVGPHGATRRLEKCILTGNEQIYDQSGNVLIDAYSFIARRLR